MPWLLTLPGHQRPWYWLYRICSSSSYFRKCCRYPCQINVEGWLKMELYVYVPWEKFSTQRVKEKSYNHVTHIHYAIYGTSFLWITQVYRFHISQSGPITHRHDDVMVRHRFLYYLTFVILIHWWPVDSPHKESGLVFLLMLDRKSC